MAQEGKQRVQKKNEIRPTMQILCKVEGISICFNAPS